MKQYIFEKTHDMDSEEFANLLHLAIGNRSAKEFALLCGVHPSNFTRIKNQAIRRACSPKLLKLIAENADPESGITIEKLAASNGYTLKEDTACPEPIPAKHLVRKNAGIEADNVSFYARMEHLVFAIISQA